MSHGAIMTRSEWSRLKYFRAFEFDVLDPGSSRHMDVLVMRMLDHARDEAKIPFTIVSGYRSPEYNAHVGGVKNSAHTRGLAVDILCGEPRLGIRIVAGLYMAGFRRIGWGVDTRKFIHADHDPSKRMPAFWDYSETIHIA